MIQKFRWGVLLHVGTITSQTSVRHLSNPMEIICCTHWCHLVKERTMNVQENTKSEIYSKSAVEYFNLSVIHSTWREPNIFNRCVSKLSRLNDSENVRGRLITGFSFSLSLSIYLSIVAVLSLQRWPGSQQRAVKRDRTPLSNTSPAGIEAFLFVSVFYHSWKPLM